MPSQETNNTQLYRVAVECINGNTVERLVPAESKTQAASRAQRRSDWPDESEYNESDVTSSPT